MVLEGGKNLILSCKVFKALVKRGYFFFSLRAEKMGMPCNFICCKHSLSYLTDHVLKGGKSEGRENQLGGNAVGQMRENGGLN